MLDQGKVIKTENRWAWVEFASSSRCASCGACRKNSSGQMVLEVENPIGAKIGDLVEVEISELDLVLSYLVIYGIPVFLLFLGALLGGLISEAVGIILGISFLATGFLLVRWIDRYVAKRKKFSGKIVRKL